MAVSATLRRQSVCVRRQELRFASIATPCLTARRTAILSA
jgi:hypothetical protein